MSATASKVMILGVDCAVASRAYEWARSGLLPNLGKLMERGVHAVNCLACYPTIAATNWATVATGTWPGTHGIVDDGILVEGMSGGESSSGLDGLPVETLWKACRRGGRKSVILRWSPVLAPQQPRPVEPVVAGGEDGGEAFLELLDRCLAQGVSGVKRALAEPWEVCFLRADLLEKLYRGQAGGGGGVELDAYRRIDGALGEILGIIGDEALVVAVSTHGVKPRGKPVDLARILEEAGLLAWKAAAKGGHPSIDWGHTKAAPQGTTSVVVNLQGRDPHGIVKPGAEYEAVVQSVIDALHGYTDPETGLKPINLALRSEDIRIVGLYGDRIGDVVYALDPRFGAEWGAQLPATRTEGGDMRGLLVMAGPGVKKGVVLDRNVWLTDVVPTVCYLAELPVPRSCEGAVLYQALEDPDAKVDELEALRAKLAGLKQVVERPTMMC